ncbi:MAG: zinc ABC transporter substrate-binding protein [Planctomycetota bacterium]
MRTTFLSSLLLFAMLLVGCGGGDGKPVRAVSDDPVIRDVMSVLLNDTGVPVAATTADATTSFVFDDELPVSPLNVEAFAAEVVTGLGTSMSEAFPDHASTIDANAAAYLDELVKLDAYGKATMNRVPEDNRTVTDERLAPMAVYGITVSPDGQDVDGLYLDGPADVRIESTYVGMMDHNFTILAAKLGAQGVDVHGLTAQLTLGHNHDHGHGGHDDDHEGHDHGDHEGHDH